MSASLRDRGDYLLKCIGYRVRRTISDGLFSKVKEAVSVTYKCKVAIKEYDTKRIDPEFVTKFLPRETSILRSLHHPNIVHIFELIKTNNSLQYIIMEMCETDLLTVVQQEERIKPPNDKRLFREIASAVHYLHEHHLVHRDLKCENVLLTKNGRAKITDFSFAKTSLGPTDLSATYCGSLAYSPPEVIMCLPYDAKKFDIWSLGVLLFVMVTGVFPFDPSNVALLVEMQKRGVVFPASVPIDNACKTLIQQMLDYNPASRPDTSTVLNSRWLCDMEQKS
ncbi:testis-specific serine/threonine-protein kinase 6 [Bombina bombina]|uniref:testis-specific serine/threonine-protein kinase 6 n=1 Tax=Bombina bombina TaxID=8345 RepID=UPI00235A50E2|nr:testis-specific serine/threonine-protein kinase 6 [Bombina bombina]